MNQRFLMLAVLFISCNAASAGQWTSPDGIVSVQTPRAERFNEVDSAPELLKHWQSQDQMVQLCVVEDDWPYDRPMQRKALEKGFLTELGGELVASSVRQMNGNDVFEMTALSKSSGYDVYTKQIVIQAGRKAYKFMAMCVAGEIEDEPDAREFLASVRCAAPRLEVTNTNFRATPDPQHTDDSLENAAGAIGQVIGYLLIPAVVLYLCLRRKRSPAV